MGSSDNKEIISKVFAAGSADALLAAMADDIRWTVIGTTKYSGTFSGKDEILQKLVQPLFAQLEAPGTFMTENLIAEGDYVVQQTRTIGRKTKSGMSCDNTYCFVYRFAGGRIKEMTEYNDTELMTAAFGR